MKKIIDFLKKKPLITGILSVAFIALSIRFLGPKMSNDFEAGVIRLAYAIAGMAFLYLISGEKTFDKCGGTTKYICLALLPTLIEPALVVVPGIIEFLREGKTLVPSWPLNVLVIAFNCLCVGLVEEVTARGLINDSLLYQFRDKKKIFWVIAIADVLIFGSIHIIGSTISTPLQLLTAVMKTLSSGLSGIFYLFMYWKTRNLWGVAIMHGLYDFLCSVPGVLFQTQEEATISTDYVSSASANGLTGSLVYGVEIIIIIVIIIWLWKKHMKDVDFDEIRRTW